MNQKSSLREDPQFVSAVLTGNTGERNQSALHAPLLAGLISLRLVSFNHSRNLYITNSEIRIGQRPSKPPNERYPARARLQRHRRRDATPMTSVSNVQKVVTDCTRKTIEPRRYREENSAASDPSAMADRNRDSEACVSRRNRFSARFGNRRERRSALVRAQFTRREQYTDPA